MMDRDSRETLSDDDAVAIEALCKVRPNPFPLPRSGLKFDVAQPDPRPTSWSDGTAYRPNDWSEASYRDEFPTMEPLEVVKECVWGGLLAGIFVGWVILLGYGCAWAIDRYSPAIELAKTAALRWWLRL